MKPWKERTSKLQAAYALIEKKMRPVLADLDHMMKVEIQRYIKDVSVEGHMVNGSKAQTRRIKMLRDMRFAVAGFVEENFGDQLYWDSMAQKIVDAPQVKKLFADGALTVGDIARLTYKKAGIDQNLIIADRLFDAASRLTVHYEDQRNAANRIIQNGLMAGANYETMIDQLTEAGFRGGNVKATPAHGKTVLQGVVMENYRAHQKAIADEIGTDLYQMSGPPPMEGDDGHRFCQDHWMEIHTEEEWIELAQPYAGEAGLIPEMIIILGNGYGCRHTYDAVAPEHRKDAEQDAEVVLEYNDQRKAAEAELLMEAA